MPKANASSDLTHGSSEVLAGNVARGLRRRRANNKAKLEAAEIARALLEEKKKAWEMQNLGGGSGVHRRAGEREGSEARPRMVIEGLDRLAKVGATGSADASGHSTQQSSARTSADGDSCRASSASFVTPRDVLNSRGSVSEDVSLGRRYVDTGTGLSVCLLVQLSIQCALSYQKSATEYVGEKISGARTRSTPRRRGWRRLFARGPLPAAERHKREDRCETTRSS